MMLVGVRGVRDKGWRAVLDADQTTFRVGIQQIKVGNKNKHFSQKRTPWFRLNPAGIIVYFRFLACCVVNVTS